MTTPSKKRIHELATSQIENRLQSLREIMQELKSGNEQNSKSSAGDKHETARAMAHLEMEKLSKQWEVDSKLAYDLSLIDASEITANVKLGSLIETDKGLFFICGGLGKIEVSSQTIFCISAQSPLAKSMWGKSPGDSAIVNGIQHYITKLY